MSKRSIAVVIPCFNLGRTLDEALLSARRQTRPPAELVIVDDGSTDIYTRQVLARLAREGHTVLRTSNRGVSAARNTGIEATSAPYLVLLDADDVLDPTYFEKAGAALDADDNLSFVSCAMRSFGATQEVWTPPKPDLIESMVNGVVHIASMFRRELWTAVGGFDAAFSAHEELDFWTSVLERGFGGAVLPEPLLNYRIRPGSMYQSAVRGDRHVELMRRFYEKHAGTVETHLEDLLVAKEAFLHDQRAHHDRLASRQKTARAELAALQSEIDDTTRDLRTFGHDRVEFGDLRRNQPFSAFWGLERGVPLDRYYIHAFLKRHRLDIRGQVLEIKDSSYTLRFGGDRVSGVDVLDIDAGNDDATIVADLTQAGALEDRRYDCVVLTQTLGVIYDVPAALVSVYRALKPGGVLLCTVPAAGRISGESKGLDADFWRFTEASLRTLLAELFPVDAFEITSYGNVLACAAFLYGLAPHELTNDELDAADPYFPVVYGVRARRPVSDRIDRPPARRADSAAVLMYHRVADPSGSPEGLCLSLDDFRAHMTLLRERSCQVLPLSELVERTRTGTLPARAVALTFDDGYSDATACAGILAEFGFPGTFFVVGAPLEAGGEFWWDTLHGVLRRDSSLPPTLFLSELGNLRVDTSTPQARTAAHKQIAERCYLLPAERRDRVIAEIVEATGVGQARARAPRPMTKSELADLATLPGVSIGAHGETHTWLPSQPVNAQETELASSKRRLEAILGREISLLSYPYGGFDETTLRLALAAGFRVAVTTVEEEITRHTDALRVPRFDVSSLTQAVFAARLDAIVGPPTRRPAAPRVLVAGWFSFDAGNATAGDLLARDVTCDWLQQAGHDYDVACLPLFGSGVDWQTQDPELYSHVVFVCGPFANSEGWEARLLQRFRHCRRIGLNLSMLLEPGMKHPFDALLERDSDRGSRLDITFAATAPAVPVAGLCLVEDYPWGDTAAANHLFQSLLATREAALVPIDTRLDVNATGLRTPQQVEGVIARMDLLLTTRLHGMVLALRNGVPAVAIDPQTGGGKIQRQANLLGWPAAFVADRVTLEDLQRAFDYCRTGEARRHARRCAARAAAQLEHVRAEFIAALDRR